MNKEEKQVFENLMHYLKTLETEDRDRVQYKLTFYSDGSGHIETGNDNIPCTESFDNFGQFEDFIDNLKEGN